MKKYGVLFIILMLLLSTAVYAEVPDYSMFSDVPEDSWAKEYIYKLKELGITSGQGNGLFGYNSNISRAEFLTFLIRVLNADIKLEQPNNQQVFSDVGADRWHYPYVSAGLENSIIVAKEYPDNRFQPDKKITREEMAVMIIRALGYDYLAKLVKDEPGVIQFGDVQSSKGYIALAKDFGIISGRSSESFAPEGNALRQEAAAMLIRMYETMNHKISSLNGFYAIKASTQMDKIKIFDTVGFGWSRLEYNDQTNLVEVNTKEAPNKEFRVPEGAEKPVNEAEKNHVKKYMMIFANNDTSIPVDDEKVGLISFMLSDDQSTQQVISKMVEMTENIEKDGFKISFDGIVVDFEGLRDSGKDKQAFVDFLRILQKELKQEGKDLIVCVNPIRQKGQAYYDGYDFKAIGEIADKVILMAHDYEPKNIRPEEQSAFTAETPTPLAPVKDIYFALKYVASQEWGIPKEKLMLQINFGSAQWNFKDGALENSIPYTLSSYQILRDRMSDANITDKQFEYWNNLQSPSFTFTDPSSGVKKVIWYEDVRSVKAKIQLAEMFGIDGISVWRLGIIPDMGDVPGQQPYYLDVMPLFEGISK
ncbi:S-layer homology domain-containing protein [Petroclostridium sp. X23]|uniref:S-layer homology domain-containing protein n=1 Tax=Petroclostridium sp. X23 TaxID=3045146 RepID=UPI0024AE0674|nr:S-layer homology domain-containing protein [Petroclostridium sp. X23]WHH59061.1 S-layer homology domain-containing protein [Petroclostridium sp. X23]